MKQVEMKSGNKNKIAFMIHTIGRITAGTEKQLIRMIEKIDRNEYDPYLICLWQSAWMKKNILPCPVKILGYRGLIKWNIFRVLAELRRFVRDKEIRIVHVFSVDPIFVACLAWLFGKERPVLISSRRDIGLGDEPWYYWVYDLLLTYVNRRFNAIVANSRNVKDHVIAKERLSEGKIRVIYNGIDLGLNSVEASPRRTETVRIVLVANMKPVKRIDLFLEAFKRVKESVDGIRIEGIILGDGPGREGFEAMATRLGIEKDVLFAGGVSDVYSYLRNVDIGVSCSDREGLSNAILEYMSFGLPVVATAVGGTPELVDDSNGICVPPGDPDALAEALRSLAIAPEIRRSLGAMSLEKIRSRFSWERTMAELQGFYRELSPKDNVCKGVDGQTPVINEEMGR